jgi:hypothetical protein
MPGTQVHIVSWPLQPVVAVYPTPTNARYELQVPHGELALAARLHLHHQHRAAVRCSKHHNAVGLMSAAAGVRAKSGKASLVTCHLPRGDVPAPARLFVMHMFPLHAPFCSQTFHTHTHTHTHTHS